MGQPVGVRVPPSALSSQKAVDPGDQRPFYCWKPAILGLMGNLIAKAAKGLNHKGHKEHKGCMGLNITQLIAFVLFVAFVI